MRSLAIVLLCAFACGGTQPTGDAAPDAVAQSFNQPIGSSCSATESVLCARGIGVCHAELCCAFCSAVALPRCPAGTTEVHETIDDRNICLCVPP